jgi:hypothetical protein
MCPDCGNLKDKWLSEKEEQFYKKYFEEKQKLALVKVLNVDVEVKNKQKQTSTKAKSKEENQGLELKGVDCLEFQLKRELKRENIKDTPNFPFNNFAEVREGIKTRKFTIGGVKKSV